MVCKIGCCLTDSSKITDRRQLTGFYGTDKNLFLCICTYNSIVEQTFPGKLTSPDFLGVSKVCRCVYVMY